MTISDQIVATARESLAFWRSQGAKDHHCWALLGNEAGESSFLPKPVGNHGEAFAAFQWHADRIAVLAQPAPHGCGIDVRDASHLDQLRAAHFEMTSVPGFRHVWEHLMATTTVEDAVTVLVAQYEHSRNQASDIAKRTALALKWRARLSEYSLSLVSSKQDARSVSHGRHKN